MKPKVVVRIFAFCLLLPVVQAQPERCSFSVFAQLVDKNLNLKTVPKLKFSLREVSATRKTALSTNFDGHAKGEVPCGTYKLTTDEPLEFDGRQYTWDLTFKVVNGEGNEIELSNDNATASAAVATPTANAGGRITDELVTYFKKYEGSVVTVWSELGHGTGFFVDETGLILTNQHVVAGSEYISVQSDAEHKVSALLLASDPEKDVAVLWANRAGLLGTTVAPLASPKLGEPLALEGERVFTIGSPLNQRKIMTTGIASKIEARAILSDININHGNSGGPLFNSLGVVIGITTFADSPGTNGPGVSGIVRIEQVSDVLANARVKIRDSSLPSPAGLPVEPSRTFPVEGLKVALSTSRFDVKPYVFEEGDYDVAVITPVLNYQLMQHSKMEASKEKQKRVRNAKAAAQSTFQPLDDLRNWAEYLGEYRAVVQIRATPKLRETFGSAFARGMTARNGVSTMPAKMRFKADFYKMSLKCADKEIQPIHPGKIAKVIDVKNRLISVTDATYEGLYTYPADAISPSCGEVSLEIYSEKNVLKAKVRSLNQKTVNAVWEDFRSFREAK
jgi:S1-C subfamily serine protease